MDLIVSIKRVVNDFVWGVPAMICTNPQVCLLNEVNNWTNV